jgi:alpha-beta hydrolase superfamily lysophospholipase
MNVKGAKSTVRYEEVSLRSNQATIVLSIWHSRNEDKCVVFIPGTATHPLFYEPFLRSLAESGFNVIGVHPVNHGKSPRTKHMFTFEDIVQNGRDAVTYAIDQINNHVIVMGSSQGGMVAMAIAGQDERIKAVFPHNVLIPQLPESMEITRLPAWLKRHHKLALRGISGVAKVMPKLPISISLYLDTRKISSNPQIMQHFYDDPLSFMHYSLHFLASLFNADLSSIQDGRVKCPVVVMAAKGDPLFIASYIQTVYRLIRAPHKELLWFDADVHLILNECLPLVLQPIVEKLHRY